jgi:hypothetical protein
MVAIVMPIWFWGGLIVAVIGSVLGIFFFVNVIPWLMVLGGLAFVYDGLTAVKCPNGHLIGLRTRFGLSPPYYCPKCGALVYKGKSDEV